HASCRNVMIERKRLLLGFIYRAGAGLTRGQLMDWLFLLRQEQPQALGSSAFYDFVPHRSGPRSFQVCRDVEGLQEAGLLTGDHRDHLSVAPLERAYVSCVVQTLPRRAAKGVEAILGAYGRMTPNQLFHGVSRRYPWYGQGTGWPVTPAQPAIYTVGYEGRTIDDFLNHLISSGIRQLIDVRRNALSRKYGFGGRTTARLCAEVDIAYVHVPALGIPSTMRTDLSSATAYDRLFDLYEATVLPGADDSMASVADLCTRKPSALMCLEASANQCHRGRLALHLAPTSGLAVKHL
ncbi:DUF488 domain-containing protein, partial [Candidatus Synechococcus spongiarum]